MSSLLTVEDLRSYYGFTFRDSEAESFQAMLDTAEAACLSYAGIELGGTVEEVFEAGLSRLVLTHTPVLSVTSVTAGGEGLGFRYEERAETVVLEDEADAEVTVIYETGFEMYPADLKAAVAVTVQHLNKILKGNLAGVTSRTTAGGTETIEQSIPPMAVKSLLSRYRVKRAW